MSPKNIQLIGDTFAISWDDGAESYIPCEILRKKCPCAACGGEKDVLGREYKAPSAAYKPESFQLVQFQPVGGYAIGISWKDGHNSGIYPFPLLKKMGEI